ncbi:glycoside hydrolase family 36 protein [Dothidotthia symphoricarpi CBS 119687]|uniref:Alpha-galactosidase n=1 Tax=Dothidotthia symphoricarpi CBS 119687 TaxID=1392245 RepID=A0A6A6A467_9PLEO|nr:glycoside hydrolase family 36 protein [Dothidotthia symphoricarpi CBS 119687]KAF2125707.1 glycoside hydrolase family 36 protein [Dothidotthia symphoricarpi CBS 119687]
MKSFPLGTVLLTGLAAAQQSAITASGENFTLTGDGMSYLFHVNPSNGDLVSDHFGASVTDFIPPATILPWGWNDNLANFRREFPDVGRSDFRLPAIHIEHADGDAVSAFRYQSHQIIQGKPPLPGLPATYGEAGDVTTLIVQLFDNVSDVSAALSYSIFPKYNAIARSFSITNNGTDAIVIERAASFSTDFPNLDLDMIEPHGDWSNEFHTVKRKVDYGETTFRSTTGYASHLHNPFFALVSPSTTESSGAAWGFNLVWTGSFEATAERFSNGYVRVLLGLNSLHTSVKVQPGEMFQSPEAVAVYSTEGVGGMSRSFHDLYRNHLSRSKFTKETRPILLNSWEGLGFNINDTSLVSLAGEAEELGIELFVNDDGWFGVEYPRNNDSLGLGDWTPNPAKFPNGLGPYVGQVNNFSVLNSATPLQFGIWVEPEMVNPNSTLYKEHPEWVLHAGKYSRSLTRNQLVLNVGLPEVQEFIISFVSRILDSANIQYVKWDNNRGMHELSRPSDDYNYILGLYRVIDNLTTKYPNVLWEGCASGGGRFDAGLLHYWPQHWTSDNTDAANRLTIQLGTSLVYPPSAMGCHISAVPNGLTNRNISIEYRGHVAMMCGSFGLELNPSELAPEEAALIPGIMAEAKRVNPMVINGDFYRLAHPDSSNWPGAQFVSEDGKESAVFAFQQLYMVKPAAPPLALRGLDPQARYFNTLDNGTYTGATYMNAGLNVAWERGDYKSELIWLEKQ